MCYFVLAYRPEVRFVLYPYKFGSICSVSVMLGNFILQDMVLAAYITRRGINFSSLLSCLLRGRHASTNALFLLASSWVPGTLVQLSYYAIVSTSRSPGCKVWWRC